MKKIACWKCGDGMVLTKETWNPNKKKIDDKRKTGTDEHIELLTLSAKHILGVDIWLESEADDFSKTKLDETITEIEKAVSLKWESGDSSTVNMTKLIGRVTEAIKVMQTALGADYTQFLVNLAMFNFHTAGGGRARKIADWLRMLNSKPDVVSYLRPYESKLPPVIGLILTNCQDNGAGASANWVHVKLDDWNDGQYVPPSRFTATLPFKIEQSDENDPKVVIWGVNTDRNATVEYSEWTSDKIKIEKDNIVTYALMGSFGFAEPSYTTWTQAKNDGEGNEYSGTRLSLGAYSLCPDYLVHVQQMVENAEKLNKQEHWEGYQRYGGVRLLHIKTLCKLARKRGYEVAIAWARQMVDIARDLVDATSKSLSKKASGVKDITPKVSGEDEFIYSFHIDDVSPKKAVIGLKNLFDVMRQKIEGLDLKVSVLEKSGYSLNNFEYIWVQEASLWEILFFAATCLSSAEIRGTLNQGQLSSWKSSISDDPTCIHDMVNLSNPKYMFHRLLAPSGTEAAKLLYAALIELNFATLSPEIGKSKLDPFTPYFEFYLEQGFLNKKHALGVKNQVGLQVWVNLSDNLHSDLLAENAKISNVADSLVKKMSVYAKSVNAADAKNLYVIDYTKFAGEMPHCVVYPILAMLAQGLVKAGIAGKVAFLRSNLKYHTGSLERYQSGEVLIPQGLSMGNVLEKTKAKFITSFKDGKNTGWSLKGEYVSLMKKVYLLADAVAWLRWKTYSEAFLQSVDRGFLDEIENFSKIKQKRGAKLQQNLLETLDTINKQLEQLANDTRWGLFGNGSLRAYIVNPNEFDKLLKDVQTRMAKCTLQVKNQFGSKFQSLTGPVKIEVLSPEQIRYLQDPFWELRDRLRKSANSQTMTIPKKEQLAISQHAMTLVNAWYRLRTLVPEKGVRQSNPLPGPLATDVRNLLEATLSVLEMCEQPAIKLINLTSTKGGKNSLGKSIAASLRVDAREITTDIVFFKSVVGHRFLDVGTRELIELKLRQVAVMFPITLNRLCKQITTALKTRSLSVEIRSQLQSQRSYLEKAVEGAHYLVDLLPKGDMKVPSKRLDLGAIDLGDDEMRKSSKAFQSKTIKVESISKKDESIIKDKKSSSLFSTISDGKNEKEDQHWYTGEEIALLLRLRLSDIDDALYIMVGIDAHQHGGFTIADNLRGAGEAAFVGGYGAILLPVHVGGNHWTALYIGFQGDYSSPTIQYADPQGTRDIPDTLQEALDLIFPGHTLRANSQTAYQPSNDGHNCGPWTVTLLEHMARNDGVLPSGNAYKILDRRKDDSSRIEDVLK